MENVCICCLPVEDVPNPGERTGQPGARKEPRSEVQRHHIHGLEREHGVDVEIHWFQIGLHHPKRKIRKRSRHIKNMTSVGGHIGGHLRTWQHFQSGL